MRNSEYFLCEGSAGFRIVVSSNKELKMAQRLRLEYVPVDQWCFTGLWI